MNLHSVLACSSLSFPEQFILIFYPGQLFSLSLLSLSFPLSPPLLLDYISVISQKLTWLHHGTGIQSSILILYLSRHCVPLLLSLALSALLLTLGQLAEIPLFISPLSDLYFHCTGVLQSLSIWGFSVSLYPPRVTLINKGKIFTSRH